MSPLSATRRRRSSSTVAAVLHAVATALCFGLTSGTAPVRLAIGVAGALLTAAGVAALAPRPVVAEPGPRAELESVP